MKLLEKSRYYSFWIWDVLRGGKIKSHYKDVKFTLENFNTSKKTRNSNLSKLLNHAVETTSFYKACEGFNSISDFPIVNKFVL